MIAPSESESQLSSAPVRTFLASTETETNPKHGPDLASASSTGSSNADWSKYRWMKRHPAGTPDSKHRNLRTPDQYILNSIDGGLIYFLYWVHDPNTTDGPSDILEKNEIFERDLWYTDNCRTSGLLFLVTSSIFFFISYFMTIPNWTLIVFILFPPAYVFVRIAIQSMINDGTIVQTLKVLNAELSRPSTDLNECLEIEANVSYHNGILMTFFTNASILVSTVVDRTVLLVAIWLSTIISYYLFCNFFKQRIYPQARAMLRLKQYWDEYNLMVNTESIQKKMNRFDRVTTASQAASQYWCAFWWNGVAFRGSKVKRWHPESPRLVAWAEEQLRKKKAMDAAREASEDMTEP